MSYARFGQDGSDVYVFSTTTDIECCFCWLQKRKWREDSTSIFGGYFHNIGETVPYRFNSNEEMITHLNLHREAGHHVPEYVFERLRDPEDAAKNIAMWTERCPSCNGETELSGTAGIVTCFFCGYEGPPMP